MDRRLFFILAVSDDTLLQWAGVRRCWKNLPHDSIERWMGRK